MDPSIRTSLCVEQAPCRPDRGGFPRLQRNRPRSRRPEASDCTPIAGGEGLLRGGGGGRLGLLRLLFGLLLGLLRLLVGLLLRRLGVGGGLLLGAGAERDEGESGQGSGDRADHEQLLRLWRAKPTGSACLGEQAPCRVSTR